MANRIKRRRASFLIESYACTTGHWANLSVCMLCTWTSVRCCLPTCQRFLEKWEAGSGLSPLWRGPCGTDVFPKGLSYTQQATSEKWWSRPIPHGCLSQGTPQCFSFLWLVNVRSPGGWGCTLGRPKLDAELKSFEVPARPTCTS